MSVAAGMSHIPGERRLVTQSIGPKCMFNWVLVLVTIHNLHTVATQIVCQFASVSLGICGSGEGILEC